MRRRTRTFRLMQWSLLGLLAVAVGSLRLDRSSFGADPMDDGSASSRSTQVQRLVDDLGAASYSRREQAATQLKRIGGTALPFLRDAAAHQDLEVRYRARKLFDVIEQVERQKILTEFLNSGRLEQGSGLPGWDRFAEIVGADAPARELFAAMYQAEPQMMSQSDRGGPELRSLVESRVSRLRASRQPTDASRVSPPATAALLFVMLDSNLNISGAAHETMAAAIRQRSIQEALAAPGDTAIRRLISFWIAEAEEVPASQRVDIAMLYDLETGVAPSLQMIRSAAKGSHLQNAIFSIAKLGGPAHLVDLRPLLTDNTPLSERETNTGVSIETQVWDVRRQLNDWQSLSLDEIEALTSTEPRRAKIAFSAQVRDVALAAMIYLIGQNPRDYGFTELQPHGKYLYSPNTVGFDSDERRQRAFRQWLLWTRLQRLQSLDVDAIAVAGAGV
ncbi:MAG: hypothetical protein KF861_02935 [Planctomycetaceae bacterium]|nr:hypothetical protein [Planctomycetaceae bacterium]